MVTISYKIMRTHKNTEFLMDIRGCLFKKSNNGNRLITSNCFYRFTSKIF